MDLKTLKDTPPWEWPDDAGTALLGILRDDHAGQSDRLIAAELAGGFTVLDDDIAHALLAIIRRRDEPEELRSMAAVSLGPALEHADTMGFEDADDEVLSEKAFQGIQQSLRKLFLDADVPQDVRRKILEASVRAPQDWHHEVVRAAYSSNDEAWRLTAVFCMRFVRGFDDQILEALDCEDPDIHYQAVCAAGNWGVDAAWAHVAALVTSDRTDKHMRLAAIDAAAGIRPLEAQDILVDLTGSDDEDIAEAAFEALAMAEGLSEHEDRDEEDDDDEDDDNDDDEDDDDEEEEEEDDDDEDDEDKYFSREPR